MVPWTKCRYSFLFSEFVIIGPVPVAFWCGEAREPQAKLCFYHAYNVNTCSFLPMAARPFPNSENALQITSLRQRICRIVFLSATSALTRFGRLRRAFLVSVV